jgi:hydrogenase maturation protease
MATPRRIVIIGVGNDFRSDDGVGIAVARRIAARDLPNVTIIAGVADGTDLIAAWTDASVAIVIDCVVSGAEPGTLHRYDGLADSIPEDVFTHYSTHAFSIPKTIALAKILGRLPAALIVYGIEGRDFSSAEGLTTAVAQAADNAVERIISDVMRAQAENRETGQH